jgi:DHA3 family macrolide efflux protein-like MFS transporter
MYKKLQTVLVNSDFFLLLLSRFISQLGDKIFLPAILWFSVDSDHGSSTKIGIISLVMVLPVLFNIFTGVFVDRYDKKRMMLFSDFIRFFLCIALYINEVAFHFFWPVIVIVFVIELLGQFYNISSAAIIPSITSQDQYLKANSYLTMIENATSIIGFACSGVLIGLLGFQYIIFINGISFFMSGLCIWKMKYVKSNEVQVNQAKKEFKKEFLEGVKVVIGNSIIRRLIITIFIVNLASASLEMLITMWAHDILRIGSEKYGIMLTAILVGSLIGSVVTNIKVIKKLNPETAISLAVVTFGFALSFITFFKSFILSLFVFSFVGISLSIASIHFSTLIMNNTEKDHLGKVFGMIQVLIRGGQPLGITIVTALLQFVPVNWMIFSIGAIVFIGGLYLVSTFRIPNINREQKKQLGT